LLFLLSIFPLYFIVSAIANNFSKAKKIIEFLVWGAGGAALLGIIQFSLQFIFGLEETAKFWTNFITPFLGSSFSKAVMENSSWLVGISGHDFFRSISVFPDPHMFSFYLNLIFRKEKIISDFIFFDTICRSSHLFPGRILGACFYCSNWSFLLPKKNYRLLESGKTKI